MLTNIQTFFSARAFAIILLGLINFLATGPARAAETLAILPFENNSVTSRQEFEPLRQGMAAILTTDLSRNSGGLKLVERQKINNVIKEIALGQTGVIDQNTATQVGSILGAGNIAFGSFMAIGTKVRIDLRIVRVETGELKIAESVSGSTDNFIELTSRLAALLARSMEVSLSNDRSTTVSGMDAAVLFSRGLEALDAGDLKKARQLFDKCTKLDPDYQKRIDALMD